jgi:adenosylmethionine---8-amino-7-oxononanoate aminotransferase
VGPGLADALRDLVARRGDLPLANVRGCGMMAAVDLRGAGGAPLDPRRRTGYAVYREAVRRGVLLRPIGDTMYLFPPLTVERGDVGEMVAVLEASVATVATAL